MIYLPILRINKYAPSIINAPSPAKTTVVKSSGRICTKRASKKNPNNLTISLLFDWLLTFFGKQKRKLQELLNLHKRFFLCILKKVEATGLKPKLRGRVSKGSSSTRRVTLVRGKNSALPAVKNNHASMCSSGGSLPFQGGEAAGFHSFRGSNRQSRRRGGFEKPEHECQVTGFCDQSAKAINAGQASDQRYGYSGYTANTTSHTALPAYLRQAGDSGGGDMSRDKVI